MKYQYLAAAILAAAVTLPTLPAKAWDVKDIQKTLSNSAVSLNETCSGTLISDTLVLTANHCIDDQYRVVTKRTINEKGVVKEEKVRIAVPGHILKLHYKGSIETSRTQIYYKIKASDSNTDLALVEAMEPIGSGVPLSCKEPSLLDQVYAIGNPHGIMFNTVTVGRISSLNRSYRDLNISDSEDPTDNGEHGFIQHTSPIAPGSSGGGLFNEAGELMGVNVRGTPQGSVYLAVPASDIRKFLNNNGVKVCGGQ